MSTDPALIDTTRSPDAPNLISDTGGYPEKRHGWKTVVEQPEADYTAGSPGRVNGIHRAVLSSGEVRLVHIGTKLYQWTGWDTAAETLTALTGAYADARSTSFTCAGKEQVRNDFDYRIDWSVRREPPGVLIAGLLTIRDRRTGEDVWNVIV